MVWLAVAGRTSVWGTELFKRQWCRWAVSFIEGICAWQTFLDLAYTWQSWSRYYIVPLHFLEEFSSFNNHLSSLYQIYLSNSINFLCYEERWHGFNGYLWLAQAPNILNRYKNDLFLAVNEPLKTFLNIWMSIWVCMLAYSLYTQFLVSKQTSKQTNKQNYILYCVNFSHFPGYSFSFPSLVIFWVHEDYPHIIILEGLCLCSVSHHHHYPVPFHVCYYLSLLVSNAQCLAVVLLFMNFIST